MDLWLGSNQDVLIGKQGVKLSNYVLEGLDFMFGMYRIRNTQGNFVCNK